jgi:CRISPR-associated protein Csd1
MMLQALYELAKNRKLLEEPDFEEKPVHFLLRVDAQGKPLSLEPTTDENDRGKLMLIPRIPPKRTVAVIAGLLVDNSRYVLGLGDQKKIKEKRLKQYMAAFEARVAEVMEATGDEGVQAVLRFLQARDKWLPKLLSWRPREEWGGDEYVAFIYDPDEVRCVHERDKVRAWWRAEREREEQWERAAPARCLITGEIALPARLHPAIKNVPQGQSSGTSIVSFNEEAFCSHGLEQGANAPVSRAAAEGYVTALNWMLARGEGRRYRRGVALGNNAVTLFWTRKNAGFEEVLFSFLETPDERRAMEMAESPLKGLEPSDELDPTDFYAVTLSGNNARLVVRDWLETTVGKIKQNVKRYFEDLRLAGDQDLPKPLWILLKAVDPPGRAELPPALGSQLMSAALRGSPFPRELIAFALRRLRVPPREEEPPSLLRNRVSLIKATLCRLPRDGQPPLEVSVSLDLNNTHPPYLLGRLFAVLERLQREALGEVNATLRDRYFSSAMAHPAVAFPRLLRLSAHHAAKAGTQGAWLERLKGEIHDGLKADFYPTTLTLEDQGLFAVGYYHQRQDFFKKRAKPEPSPEQDDA